MSKNPVQMQLTLSKTRTSHLRAGALRTKEAVMEAVKEALKNCHLDREEVAKEISRLVGEEFSIHTLNNVVSEGKQNRRFPLEYAKALTMITGDLNILRAALQPEFDVMDEGEKAAYDYGLLILEDKARSKRKKELEQKAKILFPGGAG